MFGIRRSARGAVFALVLGGCAATPARNAAEHAEAEPPPLSATRVESLIGEVATLRGLPERGAVPVYLLDDTAFVAALRQRTSNMHANRASEAFLTAFELRPRAGPGALHPSTVREVLDEQVLAFYDFGRRHIVARAKRLRGTERADEQIGILVHEIVHSLQDQHFSPTQTVVEGLDETLAYHAVLEGDATLTQIAYLATERGVPLHRAIRRATDLSHEVPLESLVAVERGAALRNAPPILRAFHLFPYLDGTRMLAELYRAGGLPLLNTLYTRPPVSTEQVLHPEKYLAGEPPIAVRAPSVPAGYRLIATDTLGELGTSVLLEGCASASLAKAAAAGWGGDHFSLLAGPYGEVVLLWSTTWDTDADAKEFAAVLQTSPTCLRSLGLGTGSIGGFPFVFTRGERVAVVRGLPEPLARAWVPSLLELPRPTLKPAPIAGYQLRPHAPLPVHESGTFLGTVYASRFLGITAIQPPGVARAIGRGSLELNVGRPDAGIVGQLMVTDRVTTPRFIEQVFDEIARSVVKGTNNSIAVMHTRPTMHPLGTGIERLWSITGTVFQSEVFVRTVIVPVCNGNGAYVFTQSYLGPYAKEVLDAWLASFRWMGPGRPPVCDMLDPQ